MYQIFDKKEFEFEFQIYLSEVIDQIEEICEMLVSKLKNNKLLNEKLLINLKHQIPQVRLDLI